MGDEKDNQKKTTEELRDDIKKRIAWFYECQLRKLYLAAFRDVEEGDPFAATLLNLISEPNSSVPLGTVATTLPRVYLDSQQPVWTRAEKDQRNKFAGTFIGNNCNWLDYKIPQRLKEKIATLKAAYEENSFASGDMKDLNDFPREDFFVNYGNSVYSPFDHDRISHAICRVEITKSKPWLIPEIFNGFHTNTTEVKNWIENGEAFINQYEYELNEVLGGNKGMAQPFSLGAPELYREWVKGVFKDSISVNSTDAIKATFLDRSTDPWQFSIHIQTPSYPMGGVKQYPFADRVKYWLDTCNNSLKEIYVNKADSDMGMCMVLRAMYLYGTLPEHFGSDEQITWRNRQPPGAEFHQFFADKLKPVFDDAVLNDHLITVQTKLQILLEENALSPRSGAIHFSPIAQEVIKQDVLRYKFWMDEPFSAFNNGGFPGEEKKLSELNKARKDLDKGDIFAEMEYWSENHYIMFASSEYLAGQFWSTETFEAGMDFLAQKVTMVPYEYGYVPVTYGDNSIKITGKQRHDRGRTRVLKWLNNKLMFGWAEFNSSGYYREHLTAILNLVDFSLDPEVKRKAQLVADLLFFDVFRFSHKGSMGAAGGRSQFKSKSSGWDNAVGDAVELLLGYRGIFAEREGDIGCCVATSTYVIPDVLLEIGTYPPAFSFVDRSRVSITFDEAPKYGIQYSLQSDQKDSVQDGFAPKRESHYPFLKKVNDEITRTHFSYGAMEDDTVFWWTMSGYFSKEVARNSLECIRKFSLKKCEVFDKLLGLIKTILPLIEKSSNAILGGTIGSIVGRGAGAGVIAGAAIGFFIDDISGASMIEKGSDDFAFFLDGSTRTRANILTFRNGDVMLSSLQNFRAGQFNFQSNVNQATLHTALNVFTTARFAGIDLSSWETGFLGGVLGGFASGGFAGAVAGAAVGVLGNEIFIEDEGMLATHGDGPGWWTGYWALPMVVQHQSAAIIAYDFNSIQKKLADCGSHLWFPTDGFDQFEKRRTSAYEDDNFALLDIGDIGPKGYWLFGRVNHTTNAIDPDQSEEGYIGVFSNQNPELLNVHSDFYTAQVEDEKKGLGLKVNDSIDLFMFADYFADKDWQVDGKNIWIIQVGNKREYGSFENFKDRVSKAKIVVDDAGDMEVTYSIPIADGTSQTLNLNYSDGGSFKVDGAPFQTDSYPRFENPFIRGGRVEWGQRSYVIEYNHKSLLHDFSNMEDPLREENKEVSPLDKKLVKGLVKGLVIYLQTGDEALELWGVAQASVTVGCAAVTTDQVIAAGEVEEHAYHDAEWIFFDSPAFLSPDMTIEIKHPASKKSEEPEWKMAYTLKALLADGSLHDCSLSFSYFHFKDGWRSTGLFPFSIQAGLWQPWNQAEAIRAFVSWQITPQPGYEMYYYDYADLLGIDEKNILWHRRMQTCSDRESTWVALTGNGEAPNFALPHALCSFTSEPGHLVVLAQSNGQLFFRWRQPGTDWDAQLWETVPLLTIQSIPFPTAVPVTMSPLSRIAVQATTASLIKGLDIAMLGTDGNIYILRNWLPGTFVYWELLETVSFFTAFWLTPMELVNDFLFVLDVQLRLWAVSTRQLILFSPAWLQLSLADMSIAGFTVVHTTDIFKVIVTTTTGEIWTTEVPPGGEAVAWERLGIDLIVSSGVKVSWTLRTPGHLTIFVTGNDGKIYLTSWSKNDGWKQVDTWTTIGDERLTFRSVSTAPVAAITRVNNQIEVYAETTDHTIWKTWWS